MIIYLGEAKLINLLTDSLLAAFHGGRSLRSVKGDRLGVFQHNATLKGKWILHFPKPNLSIRWSSTVPGLHGFWVLLHWKAALSSTLEVAAVRGPQRSHSAHKHHKLLYYVRETGLQYELWRCSLMTCDVMEETPDSSGRGAWWGSHAVDSIATNTVSSFVTSMTVAMMDRNFSVCVSGLEEQSKPALIAQVTSYPECICHTCSCIQHTCQQSKCGMTFCCHDSVHIFGFKRVWNTNKIVGSPEPEI